MVVSRYLEALYYMRTEGETATNGRLADWLGVRRPTVTVALQRMARDGLVRDRGREVELTDTGLTQAEAIVRRHRIVERWLVEGLGLDWVTADAEAARLEHSISDTVEERLWEALGRPATCPHGNPIPGRADAVPGEVRVADLPPGTRAVITRISEVAEREAPTLLQYLGERRLVPRAEVVVAEVDEVGQTIGLALDGRKLTLSRDIASRVWAVAEAGRTR